MGNMRTTTKRTPLLARIGLASATAAVLSAPLAEAWALQGGEDPATLPVLIDKRFGMKGRHQLSLLGSTSMVTKFVEDFGLQAGYQYSFNDLFGLEFAGAFFLGDEANITKEVRAVSGDPLLSDLYQLQWGASLSAFFVPVYGKMSFASEFDPAFDLFFLGGAGVAGTRRVRSEAEGGGFDSKVTPAFHLGLGLRFHFTDNIALRLEFRDYFYPDPDPEQGGLTWILHFQGGIQYTFGAAQ